MAHKSYDGWFSAPAAADYSAITKPRFVTFGTGGLFTLTALGARADGVADSFPCASGKQLRAAMVPGWILTLEAGTGGVTRGAGVSSDATGKGVVSVTSTHVVNGKAITAAAVGEVFSFIFYPPAAPNVT